MLDKGKIIRTAEKYVIAGKIAQAVGEYQKLIEQDPEEPLLLNTVGDLLARQGRQEDALGYYRQVVELYLKESFHVKAAAMLKKILQIKPGDLQSREKLAELYEKQTLKFEAAFQLRQIIESYEAAGELKQALRYAKRLTEVLPEDAEAWRDRARMSIRVEQSEPALEFFIKAAKAFRRRDEFGQAWETLIEAFPLDSGNRPLLDLLVEVAEARDQLLEARKLLESEIESTGEDFPYRFYLGLILEKLGESERAAEQYNLLRERGFDDQRVTEAMIRVGHLEPLSESETPDEEPLDLDFSEAPPDSGVGELDMIETDESSGAFSLIDQESPQEVPDEFTTEPGAGPGSGLFDLAEMGGESEPDEALAGVEEEEESAGEGSGLFGAGLSDEAEEASSLEPEPEPEVARPPQPPDDFELPQEAVASLDEALEEVDFYLKLGFSEDATNLIKRLLAQFPNDDNVISRARKARVPLPATEVSPEQPAAQADAEEVAAAAGDFENEIENALDGLFTGTQEEREPVEPVLRYDIAAKVDSKAGDYRVHYDLGLAYKEMGLLDDALEEFHQAFEMIAESDQHPQQILCCSMLASCNLQLGNLQEAVEWANRGLKIPDLKEFEIKALQYDLASALERAGQVSEAIDVYRRIAEHDNNYRDVQQRLEQLKT